jgi:hypothetical protein
MTEIADPIAPEQPDLSWGPYTPADIEAQAPTPETPEVQAEATPQTQATPETPVAVAPAQVQVPATSAVDPNSKLVEVLSALAEKINTPSQTAPVQAEPTPVEIAEAFSSNTKIAMEMMRNAGIEPTPENYQAVRYQLSLDAAKYEANERARVLESRFQEQEARINRLIAESQLAKAEPHFAQIPEAARPVLRPLVEKLVVERGLAPDAAVRAVTSQLGPLLQLIQAPAQVSATPKPATATPGQVAARSVVQPRTPDGKFSGMKPAEKVALMEKMIWNQ